MKKIFFNIAIIFIPIVGHGCEVTPVDKICMASFSKTRVAAFFPYPKKDVWEWGVKSYPDRYEYSWIAETGKCNKGNFSGSGIFFGIGVKGRDKNEPLGKHGSLSDLLNTADRSVYSIKPPSRICSKISKTDVAFKIHEPDYIAIQPIGENIVERMVDGEGMYMKMSYKSPIENESYECIVKMEYLNLR